MGRLLNKINTAAAVLLSLTMISARRAAETKQPGSPDVIIIYSDNLGYTDLGAYGIDENVDTPHMDALVSTNACHSVIPINHSVKKTILSVRLWTILTSYR